MFIAALCLGGAVLFWLLARPAPEPAEASPPMAGAPPGAAIRPADDAALASSGVMDDASAPTSAALALVAQRGASAGRAPAQAVAADALVRSPQDAASTGAAPVVVGQRVRVVGEFAERVQGEAGVTVIVLATETGGGLHLVWSPAHVAALDGLRGGQRVEADCLVQGEVLGRWILADCRA